MTIRILSPADWQTQAWKNGGGITHEVARVEDDRGLRWRVSIAEVARPGPFSRFDGLERVIVLLDGAGFRLHGVGADPQVITAPLAPFEFPGEAEVHCTLVDGPVRDFNLMRRRADVEADLRALRLGTARAPLAEHTLLHVVRGRVGVRLGALAWVLEAEQTLWVSGEPGVLLLEGAPDAAALALDVC